MDLYPNLFVSPYNFSISNLFPLLSAAKCLVYIPPDQELNRNRYSIIGFHPLTSPKVLLFQFCFFRVVWTKERQSIRELFQNQREDVECQKLMVDLGVKRYC